MTDILSNKNILLGVTGGIAAYKSADLIRRLQESGAKVRCVMTRSAKEFITPLTLQALSGYPVHEDLFDLNAEAAMGHIELARWADLVLVAPATADFMARLLVGYADDLLTTLCLATKAPIAIAPAMNQAMWNHPTTQGNVAALLARGIQIIGPAEGSQACGDVGLGRMLEPLDIVWHVIKQFRTNALSGKKVVITAGPTREAIDPVRYLSNASSGKMGYALAEASRDAGADVILISGPVNLPRMAKVKTIDVVTAEDMLRAVMKEIIDADIFISVAAVSDYRCKTVATQKMAKQTMGMTLELEQTEDILAKVAQLAKRPIVIGFAAETDNMLGNAKAKLVKKKLDMIIANHIGEGVGMGCDDNAVTILWGDQQKDFSLMSKTKLARELVAFIQKIFLPI